MQNLNKNCLINIQNYLKIVINLCGETCMVCGLDFGTGWYDIINNVCFQIVQHENNITNEKSPRYNKDYQPVRFEQTKQKMGGLRIYYDGGDEYVRGLVSMAGGMSYCVCEDCGDKGSPNKGGWISTLCENCRGKIISENSK